MIPTVFANITGALSKISEPALRRVGTNYLITTCQNLPSNPSRCRAVVSPFRFDKGKGKTVAFGTPSVDIKPEPEDDSNPRGHRLASYGERKKRLAQSPVVEPSPRFPSAVLGPAFLEQPVCFAHRYSSFWGS